MQQERIHYLVAQYAAGQISYAEWQELQLLATEGRHHQQLLQSIQSWLEEGTLTAGYDPQRWQPVLDNILQADQNGRAATASPLQPAVPVIPVRRSWMARYGWVAAAVVLLTAGAGTWFLNRPASSMPVAVDPVAASKIDVAPGREGAILTLADGTRLVLDSAGNGMVAMQSGSQVMLKDGQLSYDTRTNPADSTRLVYNTMTTPRGRQFQLMLPDGSKVWLNAGSSLRYPTVFRGRERIVEVTGEAYFEVAASKDAAFIVNVGKGTSITVLGTSFNVNAYADEPSTNTTLLQGAVLVSHAGNMELLQPGQQAQLSAESKEIKVLKDVNVKEVIAWKNGVFVFNDADLTTVMRQLARWYDVEVSYAGAVPKGVYNGKIGRDLSLSDVLDGLSDIVKYRIEEGNRIVILP
ncbi:MAG: FecR domain-containing protein [Candidatus Pseudobacter hemicellulosilyticus]|uniref:FecR domain-containing protein n=1 Tax=Candidatus Pseudobacter hemicellulosilyticus TaxID=3121375 RepID=A0AAJ5WSC6_9BACT|nr:MAG: FecR domain-containing protein [Pseudobacter sp.]